jgi:integrase
MWLWRSRAVCRTCIGPARAADFTTHTHRHTAAMYLLQSGVEVNVIRSWLGHTSTATTNGCRD